MVGTALCAAGGFLLIVLTEPKRLFATMQADPDEQEREGIDPCSRGPRLKEGPHPRPSPSRGEGVKGRRSEQGSIRPPLGSSIRPFAVVFRTGADHQRFADFFGAAADGVLDPLRDVGIFLEIDLRVLAALADADAS